MATRRTTSDKRQRERDKQAKAAAKRERRQERAQGPTDSPEPRDTDELSTEQLLARIEMLHADYDAGTVSFEDFDLQKAELLDQIALRLAE